MPTVAIAYYSAMVRYWYTKYQETKDPIAEIKVIEYLTKLVKAIQATN